MFKINLSIKEKSDVVHVHLNNELTKKSKIEEHLRACATNEAKNSSSNLNRSAFDCNYIPKLVLKIIIKQFK